MAVWTGNAAVITHGDLLTFIRSEGYFESAAITAIASLSLTGDPRIYPETASIASVSAVSASDIRSTIGGLTNPLPIVDGTGLTGTVSQGAVVAPVIIALGGEFKVGDIIASLPVVSGTLLPELYGTARVTSPIALVTGSINSGESITGSVQVPIAQVNAKSGSSAAIQPSVPVVNATGLTGRVGTGVVRNASARVSGASSQKDFWVGNVLVASSTVSGEMSQGTVNIGDVQNRVNSVNATGVGGTVGTGAVTSPSTVANITLVSEVFLNGEIILPSPLVRGYGSAAVANFITWVLNTESNQTTNYTEFPFIALGHMGAVPVGAAADGIYLLTGDTDEGTAIDSIFKFGMADFRSGLANVSHVYVGGDIEGDMEISILEDGQDIDNIYTISERERHVRGHHAKLGKGFRSRYRQLSLSNVNGGNFELDSLSLSSRDLKGNE